MLLGIEHRVDDDAPLIRDAKILLLEEIDKFPLRFFSHFHLHCGDC